MRHVVVGFLTALLFGVTSASAADGPPDAAPRAAKAVPIAVLDLTPVGTPPELAANLTAVIAAELGRYNDVRPVTRRDVASMLDVDRQK